MEADSLHLLELSFRKSISLSQSVRPTYMRTLLHVVGTLVMFVYGISTFDVLSVTVVNACTY